MVPSVFADISREPAMAAVTLSEVSALTERESVYWYFGGAFKSARRHVALFVLLPFLLLVVFVLAQAFPYRMRAILDELLPRLPRVTDKAVLGFLRDLLSVTLCVAVFYRPFCIISRGVMASVVEDLDETVDSLNFALENWEEMSVLVKECSKTSTPELPLFAQEA